MKNRILILTLAFATMAAPALAIPGEVELGLAQTPPASSSLPPAPAVEKELAAKASNVTEVTLDKSMLGFAAKFMNGKNKDDAGTSQFIQGLDAIYVRDYEFDKEGQFSADDIDKLRQAFETADWSPIVRDRERKGAEMTDVMVKMVNGESRGLFVLSAEPKEISIVMILGPVRMDQLGMLQGLSGLSGLSGMNKVAKGKDKEKDKSDKSADQ
jgi:hypothetical protein